MKKQHLRAIVLLTSLAAVTPVVHEPAAAEAIGAKPNIILFLTDDQDKESIGAYGADVLTPSFHPSKGSWVEVSTIEGRTTAIGSSRARASISDSARLLVKV